MNTLRYVDLFCGLGAFHSAFDATDPSRFQCVLACDIDPEIRAIYKANYGIEPLADIRQINLAEVPDFDLLCAGFPCQPFSIAGNGEGFQDTDRGNLFLELCKWLDVKQPPMCILENVRNLASHDEGRTYRTIETELTRRGYTVQSKILNAAEFGSPQARERLFIVAVKGQPAFAFPEASATVVPVSTILDPTVTRDDLNRSKYILVEKKSTRTRASHKPHQLYDVVSKETKKGGRQGERVYSVDSVGITICASSGGPGAKTGLYKVGHTIRRLSVKECLQMFGFSINYQFPGVREEEALFFLGNSIVVTVLKAFVPQILKWFAA